ncbi:hypothetical protein HPB50_021572 [Hyalomma asiaticum]|uniref:Uncharacterized protein n=1 Tax=Hyalomma asiaticum TaxID=266040 RepID=A0ACB7T0Y8_HYAAI|nr:hypothetical protein HPB50_021572 [Hyalomma asiaticum]
MLNSTRQSTSAWTDWWSSLDPVTYNVVVYAIIIGGLVLSSMARTVAFFVMCMRASVNLHNRMFSCIIRAPIRFFDMNPIDMGVRANEMSRIMLNVCLGKRHK